MTNIFYNLSHLLDTHSMHLVGDETPPTPNEMLAMLVALFIILMLPGVIWDPEDPDKKKDQTPPPKKQPVKPADDKTPENNEQPLPPESSPEVVQTPQETVTQSLVEVQDGPAGLIPCLVDMTYHLLLLGIILFICFVFAKVVYSYIVKFNSKPKSKTPK